jgi:hypothetical protein
MGDNNEDILPPATGTQVRRLTRRQACLITLGENQCKIPSLSIPIKIDRFCAISGHVERKS